MVLGRLTPSGSKRTRTFLLRFLSTQWAHEKRSVEAHAFLLDVILQFPKTLQNYRKHHHIAENLDTVFVSVLAF